MKKRRNAALIALLLSSTFMLTQIATAQEKTSSLKTENEQKDGTLLGAEIHGTIRGKYEYQTEESEGRFEVRNARVGITGRLSDYIEYKAEIDLCDEGKIKMLDAYTQVKPLKDRNISFTIGQMRVPFTIDAHRSPHQQYFANRSFIAKQVGNVRDVGAKIGYKSDTSIPITYEIGAYNGSGLTNQKDFWTKNINFSTKLKIDIPNGFNVTLSCQKIRPEDVTIMMYDAGTYWHSKGWHIEAEYLHKHYADNEYKDVNAVDFFVCRDIRLKSKLIKKVSPLARYDWMSDHSDGNRKENHEGNMSLITDDYERHRLTAGITLSLDKPFISDIRVNYEKYWYPNEGIAKTSEKDKIAVELMTRF